jgi:hypothetical protein
MFALLLLLVLNAAPQIKLQKLYTIDLKDLDISWLDGLSIDDRRIYYSDWKDNFVFYFNYHVDGREKMTVKGRDLTRVGKHGKGKGEFVAINDLKVYENKIYIADKANAKIIMYSLDGSFLKELVFKSKDIIPATGMQPIGDKILLLSAKYSENGYVYLVDYSGDAKPVKAPEYEEDFQYNMIYHSEFTFHDGHFYIAGVYNNNLVKIDATGNVVKVGKIQDTHALKYASKQVNKNTKVLSIKGSDYLSRGLFGFDKFLIIAYSGVPYASVRSLRLYDADSLTFISEKKISELGTGVDMYLRCIAYNDVLFFLKAKRDKKAKEWKDFSFDVFRIKVN